MNSADILRKKQEDFKKFAYLLYVNWHLTALDIDSFWQEYEGMVSAWKDAGAPGRLHDFVYENGWKFGGVLPPAEYLATKFLDMKFLDSKDFFDGYYSNLEPWADTVGMDRDVARKQWQEMRNW